MNDEELDDVGSLAPQSIDNIFAVMQGLKDDYQGNLRVDEFIALVQASAWSTIEMLDTRVEALGAYGSVMYGALVAVMNMYDFQLEGEEEYFRGLMLDVEQESWEEFGSVPMIMDWDAIKTPLGAAIDSIDSMKFNAGGVAEDVGLDVDEVVHFGVLGVAIVYMIFLMSRRGRVEAIVGWPFAGDVALEMANLLFAFYSNLIKNLDEAQED
jgi:hypothetical protein